jgi:hypothetical protein
VHVLRLAKQVPHVAMYLNLANFFSNTTGVCMSLKFWTFGISLVLLAAYLCAYTCTYLSTYLLTSISTYPLANYPLPTYIPTYPPPSFPCTLPTYLATYPPPYVDAQLLTNTHTHTPVHLHTYLSPRWMGRRADVVPTEI